MLNARRLTGAPMILVEMECVATRWLSLRLNWSLKPHNTTVRTDSRQGSRNQKHYCLCQRLKPIRLGCYLPRLSGANKVSLFRVDSLARYLLQCAWDSSVVAMVKTYLIELVRDVTPLWDQRDKNYHKTDKNYRNRDPKPKFWDEIGKKLNVTGKYWNNNTCEVGYYLLLYIQFL